MSDQMSENEPKPRGQNRRSFLINAGKAGIYATAAFAGLINLFEARRSTTSPQQAGAQIPGVDIIDLFTTESRESEMDELFKDIKTFVFNKYKQSDLSQINQKIELEARNHLDKTEYFPPFAAKIKGYHELIINAAKTIQEITGKAVEPEWIGVMFGLILSESSGDPKAVHVDPDDPNNEEKKDRGLCQIRIPTEKIVREKLNWGEVDIFDPGINITIGLEYLMILMDKYQQDPLLALSAYNFGDGDVDAHKNIGGSPLTNPGIENVIKVLGSTKAVLSG